MTPNSTRQLHAETTESPDETAPPAIETTNVAFTYPDGTEAVRDVSVSVRKGEFFGLDRKSVV